MQKVSTDPLISWFDEYKNVADSDISWPFLKVSSLSYSFLRFGDLIISNAAL